MSKIEMKNVEGKAIDSIELSDSVYGIEPNIPVTHQVVVAQQSNMRQGTHAVKNRSAVSGGGRKPWNQKGTGRARQGSIRSPQWVGGGVVFGPTPRDHKKRINNKMSKLAMRSVLSGKVRDNELVVVDNFGFDKPSTKQGAAFINALELAGKRVTVVVEDDDMNTYLSLRNIERVDVISIVEASAMTLIDNNVLVMSADIAKKLEEVLA